MELKQAKRGGIHKSMFLLIVPYGIETGTSVFVKSLFKAFNRTLWN